MRLQLAGAVATLTFLGFAGCTSDTPVNPTTSTCAIADSTVAWGPKVRGEDALIAVYLENYSRAKQRYVSKYTAVKAHVTFDDQSLRDIVTDPTERSSWQAALLAGARRTGQVPADFGTPPDVPTPGTPLTTPALPSGGTFVNGITATQYRMPFSITCEKGTVLRGFVTGAISTGYESQIYACSDTHNFGVAAFQYCDLG